MGLSAGETTSRTQVQVSPPADTSIVFQPPPSCAPNDMNYIVQDTIQELRAEMQQVLTNTIDQLSLTHDPNYGGLTAGDSYNYARDWQQKSAGWYYPYFHDYSFPCHEKYSGGGPEFPGDHPVIVNPRTFSPVSQPYPCGVSHSRRPSLDSLQRLGTTDGVGIPYSRTVLQAVIGKQTHTRGHNTRKIIDIKEKQKRTQNSALRYSRHYLGGLRGHTIKDN
ncbi:hypothetical protein Bbelb_107850 [Branchiostoma belcheri]|nr:hypothetical protein Bbelb_107850 [Branchiostoma belcheri]